MNQPVYLIDDDRAVRDALVLVLDTVGIPTRAFEGSEAFLHRLSSLEPGCIVLDIRMPAISGLRLQERLRGDGIDWPMIVISGHGTVEACRRAFRGGAIDFLSKPIDEDDLIDAVQRGRAILDDGARIAAERAEAKRLLGHLTARERDVLAAVVDGFATRQIADAFGLSPRTVESHRAAICAKLGTTSPAEMTRLWLSGAQDDPDAPRSSGAG